MISLKAKLEDAGYNVDMFESATTEAFRRAISSLAYAAHSEWIRLAQERLRTSQDLYINGLQAADSFKARTVDGEPYYDITLVGNMPNNVEFGMAPFDMKAVRPGWLGGGKAKFGKDGKAYVVIPFRHSTGSGVRFGYSGGPAMRGAFGVTTRADARNRMKTELKKVVKDYGLNRMIRAASGKVIRGPVKRAPARAPIHQYLKGLTRVQTATAGKTSTGKQRGSGQLITWRIMSENSAPESWLHPGIEAVNLLDEVSRWANNQLDQIIDNVMDEASKT